MGDHVQRHGNAYSKLVKKVFALDLNNLNFAIHTPIVTHKCFARKALFGLGLTDVQS